MNNGGKWDVTDWLQISIGTAKEVAGDASVYEMAFVEILNLRESLKSAHAVATAFATKIQEVEAENKELHEMVDDLAAWNEGVEADNDTLRKEIARLREERDAARLEVCELSGNGSIDSASRVAEERGWDLTEEDDGEANTNNNLFRSTDMS
jgi:predicted nuclease with TOPRIM domain